MKKNIKLNEKLSFNKETIAKLNDDQMSNIEGGSSACPSIKICSRDLIRTCAVLITEDCTPTEK